jgi:pimeloyl-ACP methyl ester carboxylesterase
MRRGFVDTLHGQTFYREAGSGAPIVLLHQILRTSLDYEFVIPLLAGCYRVIAFDNVGCGDSDAPPHRYSVDDHAAAIAAAMDGLGIKHAALAGHHSGANLALELALQRPDLARSVIMSGLFYVEDPRQLEALHLKALTLQDPEARADGSHLAAIWEEGLRTNWGKPRFPPERTDLLTKFFVEQIKTGPRRFEPYVAVMTYATATRLPLLRTPCLFISARDDVLMCNGTGLWARDQPDAEIVEITFAGGGEMPRLAPEAWSAAVLRFLAAEESRAISGRAASSMKLVGKPLQ